MPIELLLHDRSITILLNRVNLMWTGNLLVTTSNWIFQKKL